MAAKKSSVFSVLRRLWRTVLDVIAEHREYRAQIFQLATADLVKTYRGSALGWAWAIIKPSVTIFVFWFAFSVGLRSGGAIEGYPFFLWLIAGIIPWFYISEMFVQGAKTLKRYNHLVTKIKFPVSTIATFVSLSKLYVHIALMAIVVLIFVIWGFPPDIYYLQLPFYMGVMFLFFTLWSLFAAPLSAVSKDFSNVVSALVTAIFWMSGIMWDAHKVEIEWLRRILLLNPVTYIANGYRNVFIYKRWFFEDTYATIAFACVLFGMFALSMFTHYRLRREIADAL